MSDDDDDDDNGADDGSEELVEAIEELEEGVEDLQELVDEHPNAAVKAKLGENVTRLQEILASMKKELGGGER
jgi:hypothetical protein